MATYLPRGLLITQPAPTVWRNAKPNCVTAGHCIVVTEIKMIKLPASI